MLAFSTTLQNGKYTHCLSVVVLGLAQVKGNRLCNVDEDNDEVDEPSWQTETT